MNTDRVAVDLFAGCGGLTAGLKTAGYAVVGAIEVDRKAAETYRLNHPSVHLIDKDITTVSTSTFMKALNIKKGQLDLLAGCPPCQGFSRLRTRNTSTASRDARNNLVFEFVRFVQELRPKNILFENVPTLQRNERFSRLCSALRQAGYALTFSVSDACHFGVPQRRKRLIVLGSRNGTPVLPLAEPGNTVTVRQTIGSLPLPDASSDELHRLAVKHAPHVMALIRAVSHDGGSRSDLPSAFQLACHQKTDGFRDVYGRMRWDAPAPTITSGCTNPSKGRFIHPDQDRAISLREAALLQGFPLDYKFIVSHGREAIAAMIGNAFPPPFIARHAEALHFE